MYGLKTKDKNNFLRLLLILKFAEYKKSADSLSEILLFLAKYSFLFQSLLNKSDTCSIESPQLYTAQENREIGARYLDPKYSRWISTDPALGDYIPSAGKGNSKDAGNLPGMGGVYNHINFHLYHYAGNNPMKYVDPTGCWTISAGIGKGVAAKVKFGHNEGKWELSWRVGFGVGGELSLDFSDSSFAEESKIGVYAEIDGGIEGGAYSLDLSAQVGIEGVVDSENNSSIEYPNNAELSVTFNGEVSASVTLDHGELEINPPSFNTEKSVDIGAGAMLFMGFGGEGVLKNDE